VALEIPTDTRERISALVSALKPSLPGVRWLSPDSYHLTLRFLGPSSPEALAALEAPLGAAAAATPAFAVRVGGLGVFPSPRAARVLWLGLSPPPGLHDLQKACESAAVSAGYAPEARPWRSHLTLGRWREPARLPPVGVVGSGGLPPVGVVGIGGGVALPYEELGETRLFRLVLFRSDLKPAGAVHTPLREWLLS
jgi:RNA 2',3'-cyclic 3'-phosphodiesterase